MSLTNTAENDLINALVLGTDPTWRSTAGTPSLYLALHTASPTEAGSYDDEATYTGYTRIEVVRSAAGWTVSGGDASNAALVQFPECTGIADSEVVTHLSIGTALSGGTMLASGALAIPRTVTIGIQPQAQIGTVGIGFE